MKQQQLTESQVAALLDGKLSFWKILERNGNHMPDFNQPIITMDFLREVKDKQVYVPQYVDVKLRPCPDKPTQLEAAAELTLMIEENVDKIPERDKCRYLNLVAHINKRSANVQWLLNILSTLTDGTHRFF